MDTELIVPGDIVHAATDLTNDGTHPAFGARAVLARAGARGVVVKTTHAAGEPRFELLLVRFEQPDGELGPSIGCWPSELLKNHRRARLGHMNLLPLPRNDYAPGGYEYD